jgi:hypothetical protein
VIRPTKTFARVYVLRYNLLASRDALEKEGERERKRDRFQIRRLLEDG